MAKDSDSDFLSSMEELGLSADDAQRLMRALLDADECTSEEPAESPAAPPVPAPAPAMPMPAAAAAPPPPPPAVEELPDEDFRGLIGRRVLIHSLKSRADLNGQCGTALSHDPATGRYTVTTEGKPSVTVALKPANLDADKAKEVPLPKRGSAGSAAAVDVSDGAAATPAAAPPSGESKRVEQSKTAMEDPERTAMYLAAEKWKQKKVVDPRSAEAFYKAKNKKKRDEEEAGLAKWKAEHPEEAAKLEAAKLRARQGLGRSFGMAGSARAHGSTAMSSSKMCDAEASSAPSWATLQSVLIWKPSRLTALASVETPVVSTLPIMVGQPQHMEHPPSSAMER